MSKDEAIKLAIEAMRFALHVGFDESSESQIKKCAKAGQQHNAAIKALEEALKQEQVIQTYSEKHNFQQEQDEHYKGVIEGVQKLFDDKRKAKQEQGEPVVATDIQISYEAHIEDPEDWNDLNFKECWHKGFADGFRAAETFHKIGAAK